MTPAAAFDLVIIGGGPAGIVGAGTAGVLGKSVALIDSHHELGGAGVNTGTVPSKTLRETALALSGMRSRNLYGVDLSLRREVTVSDFLRHERNVKAGLNLMLSQQLGTQRAQAYCGTGAFEDPHLICVRQIPKDQTDAREDIVVRGERVLIATGSSPLRPPLFPWGSRGIYDSDTILELAHIPKILAVVGAGTIGSEYASTFAALGAKVHLIDGRDALLPFLDVEVSGALVNSMQCRGITFHWKENVERCTVDNAGVTLVLSSGATLTVDEVLVAAGRKSNTQNLNLSAAGVNVGERGLIPVDQNYLTNVPTIYAAGDVIGFPALASTSMEQARRAVRNAFGNEQHKHIPSLLPSGVYTIPEVGMVGETEESLQKKGIQYVVGRARYEQCSRGKIIGDTDGFLKLLFRRQDLTLCGVHVMGEQATEVVHVGLMAMLTQTKADIFIDACFNLPSLSILYKMAAFDALRHMERGD